MKKILLTCALGSFLLAGSSVFADASEKAKATSEQVTGSIQSSAGEALGDKEMQANGETKKLKGDLRSTKEDVKDKLNAN